MLKLAVIACTLFPAAVGQVEVEADYILRGAEIYDGSGGNAVSCHVAIKVDRGMRNGAWGLATGLIYNPGTYARTDELIALAKVAARHGGFYASHIRNEGDGVMAAIEEILTIARRAGLRVHISHIKVTGRRNHGRAGDVIAMIRKARSEGVAVTADQYPYIASSTSL